MTDPATGVALIVIDMQNDYCHPDGVFARAGLTVDRLPELVDGVNTLVAAARAGGRPIVWVRMEWSDDDQVGLLGERSPFLRRAGLRAGTWGSELLSGLDARGDDIVTTKPRFSAFFETPLEDLLRERGVGRIVVVGVRTDFCVESTVRDAFFRDLEVVVVADAVAGYFEELHRGSLRVMGTVFADVVDLDAGTALLRDASLTN
ncbi:cysteine hydrolase family protein [Streptosporangium sp. CA-135522]|uniref:cysteine hydrolase family protein n=1 Tax=Streptosporangium sp. CA-135522 TaxID=3240072 RepID=UPI003D8C881F